MVIEHCVLGKRDYSLIVDTHHHGVLNCNSEAFKKLRYPYRIFRNLAKGNVLRSVDESATQVCFFVLQPIALHAILMKYTPIERRSSRSLPQSAFV